jgi:cytidine deaminase
LLLDNGQIVTGSNFENASYGMTLCAETVAISKANSDGQLRTIREIAVAGGLAGQVGTGADPITPCGRCRQIIKEVADLTQTDIPVHCAHATGYATYRLSELLPHGFGPASLK